MRKYVGTAFVLALVVGMLLVAVGCSEKGTTPGGDSTSSVGSLQIVLGDDTLQFLPGDSASTSVTIIVRDRSGVVMPGQKVAVSLSDPNLGLIEYVNTELRDTSDAFGRVQCIYRSYSEEGDNMINVSIGGVIASVPIVVQEAVGVVGSIRLQLSKNRASAADSVMLTITLRQTTGAGIPNVNVNIGCDLGIYTPPPATDAGGRTTTWWYPNGDDGLANIWVSAGGQQDADTVHVEAPSSIFGTLTIASNVLRINADGCVTSALITATLRDYFGTAIPNDTLYFGTPSGEGYINGIGVTDSAGTVIKVLCGGGIPNEADINDSATVSVRYPDWGLTDSVHIRIDPAAAVANVTLSAGRYQGIAGLDSIALDVLATYDNNARVNGVYAYLFRECGSFAADSVLLANGNFNGDVYWKVCNTVTPPTNPAELYVIVGGVESNHIQMIVDPGPARKVEIGAHPLTVLIHETADFFAQVKDSLDNNVRAGAAVIFSSTSGTLTPPSPIATDIDGIARVTLNAGVVAGPVTVKAELGTISADSSIISVLSSGVSTIQLVISPPSVEVAGTGGQSSTTLRADVRDPNNNPAPDGIWVTFEILGGFPGGGININNHGFIDSAQTANGIALATLNAGTTTGPFNIQARVVWEELLITANASNGSVVAGPPDNISIGITEVADDAISSWDLQVSALVQDSRNNAVRCSVAVFFDVEPDSVAQILSQNVVVCNPDNNGDSRPGVAYTTLRFNSRETFRTVLITASTAAPGAVSSTRDFILPLQTPTLELVCDPIAWHFPSRGDPSQIHCQATLVDGHSTRIDGATIVFTCPRGEFFPQAVGGTRIADSRRFTGPHPQVIPPNPSNDAGQCYVYLRCAEANAFASPLETERNAEVRAEVEGYGAGVDAVQVTFQR